MWLRCWGPHLCREGSVTDTWARGDCTRWGTCPGAKMRTTITPGLTLSWTDESGPPALEDADWLMSIPLGPQLDLTSLGSMKWTVYNYLAMGEVWFECQTWVAAQTTLQLTLSKSSNQLDSFPQIEELWANAMLFTWPTRDYTTPRLLGSDQKCVVS